MILDARFFDRPALTVAPDLIGAALLIDGIGGVIVETEAYHRDDPASHSFPGPTKRNAIMFAGPAYAYIYFIYGVHWCLNFTCADAGAVLIRAIEPTHGLDLMAERRRQTDPRNFCSGPGKLAQALGVGPALNGLPLFEPPFSIHAPERQCNVAAGPRIGISKAMELHWRFGSDGSRYLSRKF